MKEIPLTQGFAALVDDEDWEQLARFKWQVLHGHYTHYAQRMQNTPYKRVFRMHRELLRPPTGMTVDHINGNGLDNRRSNLRLASYSQNQQNKKSKIHSSQFKGVSWHKKKKKWEGRIRLGRLRHLGYFASEMEAALAYDAAALESFGEFALL